VRILDGAFQLHIAADIGVAGVNIDGARVQFHVRSIARGDPDGGSRESRTVDQVFTACIDGPTRGGKADYLAELEPTSPSVKILGIGQRFLIHCENGWTFDREVAEHGTGGRRRTGRAMSLDAAGIFNIQIDVKLIERAC